MLGRSVTFGSKSVEKCPQRGQTFFQRLLFTFTVIFLSPELYTRNPHQPEKLHWEILHWQIYLLENVTPEFCYTGTPVPEFVLHRKNKPGKSDAG